MFKRKKVTEEKYIEVDFREVNSLSDIKRMSQGKYSFQDIKFYLEGFNIGFQQKDKISLEKIIPLKTREYNIHLIDGTILKRTFSDRVFRLQYQGFFEADSYREQVKTLMETDTCTHNIRWKHVTACDPIGDEKIQQNAHCIVVINSDWTYESSIKIESV